MATKRNVLYKCPFCNDKYSRADLVNHIEDEHPYDIPKGFTPFRYVFNYVNKKPTSYHGKCTECGGPTDWDENKGRYNRQCNKQACHDSYVKKFEDNMMRTRGTTRMTATADGQMQMLANRKISGEYKFQNGKTKTYTGSYEKKALEFMDKVLNINPDDIMAPGPILEYTYQDTTHIYITDFYYQPYNLIIEVKDGGDNPNKRNMPDYRAKQIAKEQFIIKHTNYNYLRLTNNNLNQLMSVFANLKLQMIENSGERVIDINESVSPIGEMMNALNSGKVPGLSDFDAYIVNYPQNNIFDNGIKITNGTFDTVFSIDDKGIFTRTDTPIDEGCRVYRLGSTKEVSKVLKPLLYKHITESELYEALTGFKLLDYDQIKYNLEEVSIPDKYDLKLSLLEDYLLGLDDIYSELNSIKEVVYNGQQ